jgi:hypothetical protein
MNSAVALRRFIRHVRREEYGSAVQLANDELVARRFENVAHFADILDEWESGSELRAERAFCVRSVFRSVLFESGLRRATAFFCERLPLPPKAAETAIPEQETVLALTLRLSGMDAGELNGYLEERWRLTREVTTEWAAPRHGDRARPLLGKN